MNSPTIDAVIRAGAQHLRAAGISDAGRDARLLAADALRVAASRLTLMARDPWPAEATARWEGHLSARTDRKPISHILGTRLFYGRSFKVTSDVLDPRPETETLIALALRQPAETVLDLGTGSGCILLTLLAEWPSSHGVGRDASAAALAIARQNADRLGVSERAHLSQGDWAAGLTEQFDLIVSNPPYIAAHELAELAPEVRLHEPHIALTPGIEGLEAYRVLIPQAFARLHPQGRLLLEIGPTQGASVLELCHRAGFEQVRCHPDLDGRDRVVSARRP